MKIFQLMRGKTLDFYIYDDVESDSYDWWNGEKIESKTSANYFKKALDEAGDVEDINLYINSYSGDVKEGLGICSLLERQKAHKTAYIDGFACSIASVIPTACDEVVMSSGTMMMLHHAWTYAYGNATELRKAADDIEAIDKAISVRYLNKSAGKLTEEKLKEILDNETWISAVDCIAYGLADKIATREPQEEEAKEYYQKLKAASMNRSKSSVSGRKPVPPTTIEHAPEPAEDKTTLADLFKAAFKKEEV